MPEQMSERCDFVGRDLIVKAIDPAVEKIILSCRRRSVATTCRSLTPAPTRAAR